MDLIDELLLEDTEEMLESVKVEIGEGDSFFWTESDLRLSCRGGDALELANDRDGEGGVQVVFRQLHL